MYLGKGIESQGLLLPVCGKPCFDRKVEKVFRLLEPLKDLKEKEPFHEEPRSPQGMVLAAVLA